EAFRPCGRPGVFTATSAGIHGVAANEFLLMWIFQVLPARHPNDGVVADAVGEAGLTGELREIARSRLPVEVIAQITSKLSAGIGNARGPATRPRIQQDACRFDIGGSHD